MPSEGKNGTVVMAPTSTIECVHVVRPLKVVALMSLAVGLIILVVSIATTAWLKTDGFRLGLFEECVDEGAKLPLPADLPPFNSCSKVGSRGNIYVPVSAVLLVVAAILDLSATIFTAIGLKHSLLTRKYFYYRCAVYMALLAVLLELIALVVFPVCFYVELKELNRPDWDFDWAYVTCWISTLFTFGSALLLMLDQERDEVYFKEKSIMATHAGTEANA